MARFQHPNDFWGTSTGRLDGRRARLEVSDTKGDFPYPVFMVTLTDEDRDVTRLRAEQWNAPKKHGHVLRDFGLKEVSGGGEMSVGLLLLHTWDTEHVTMTSLWGGASSGPFHPRVLTSAPPNQPLTDRLL